MMSLCLACVLTRDLVSVGNKTMPNQADNIELEKTDVIDDKEENEEPTISLTLS